MREHKTLSEIIEYCLNEFGVEVVYMPSFQGTGYLLRYREPHRSFVGRRDIPHSKDIIEEVYKWKTRCLFNASIKNLKCNRIYDKISYG